jgi:E3 ubiquitin-protein ligase HUWE1
MSTGAPPATAAAVVDTGLDAAGSSSSSGGGGGDGSSDGGAAALGGAGPPAGVAAVTVVPAAGREGALRRRLLRFLEDHREVVNALARADPGLLGGCLAPLVMLRDARVFMDFNNKRAFFKAQLRAHMATRAAPAAPLQLSVRRKAVFAESFAYFNKLSSDQLRGRLDIKFKGEEGIDAGGLTREWFEILAREMFNANYALFVETEDGATFQPNPNSQVNEDHLSYFRFVGRAIAKAVCDGQLLDAHFTRSFYKHMLGVPVTYHDIEALDPQYYSSLNQLLGMPIDELGLELFFTAETEFLGRKTELELVPGGAAVAVTDANKWDYVQLLAAHKMTSSIRGQTNAFLAGFHELIPPSLISLFTESELELLIAGLPSIDVADLRAHTEYVGFRPTDEAIQWFWAALESFDQQDRARFLMFATGTSKVPLGGFKALRGQRGAPQRFTIERAYGSPESLPVAHTCFNTINLVPATDAASSREKLLIAIREAGEGFGLI